MHHTEQLTGAEFIARTLAGYGVTHAFVVPTIASRTLIAMDEHTGIERVVTHSEIAAAYMADGYARAARRLAVCGAQNVGRANLAAGLQDPFLGGSPVLALTGGPLPSSRSRHFYQEVDAFPMFGAVTKSSVHLESVDRLSQVLHQAVRDATTGQPGPVHIELEGHAGETVEQPSAEFDLSLDDRFGAVPPFRPSADSSAVEAALSALNSAERPIIVAGGGVRWSGAEGELRRFAEHWSIPVATSLNAKEVMVADHPLNVGVVGLYSRKSANRAVQSADLVVFVGSRTSSQVTMNWQVPSRETQIVHIDLDPAELGRHYLHTIPVLGDARMALAALLAGSPEVVPDRSAWTSQVSAMVQEFYAEVSGEMTSDAVPMRPERLCRELSHLLPSDALLVADTGHAGMWTAGMIDLRHEDQGYIRAAGSLGWGVPAAIGAQLAVPHRPVVLFTGDGGFWYHIAEIETAVRWNVPVVIVVNDNASLNQEIRPFTRAYDGELRGRHSELWHFEDVDLARVAEAMGAKGIRVTKPAELAAAMAEAVETHGPVVVDVTSDREALAPLGFVGPTA